MQNVTMELRDKNGGTISRNETLYKDQSHLFVHIIGVKGRNGLREVVLRRTNGEIVPSAHFVEAESYVGETSIVLDFKVMDVLSSFNKQFLFFNVCLLFDTNEVRSCQFKIKSKKTEHTTDKKKKVIPMLSNVLEILKSLVNQEYCTSCTKKNGDHAEGCTLTTTTQEFDVYFKSNSKKHEKNSASDTGNSKKMKTLVHSSQTTTKSAIDAIDGVTNKSATDAIDDENSKKRKMSASLHTTQRMPQTTTDAFDDENSKKMKTLASIHSSTSVSPEVCSDFRFLFDDVPCSKPEVLENETVYYASQIQRNDSLSDHWQEMPWSMEQQHVVDDLFD